VIRTDDVVRLAEQATLGSLLLNPQHFGEVEKWLRGQDFTDPWHRQVWTLMREAHTAHAPLDAIGLGAVLRERLAPHQVQLVRVHDLLRAAPAKADARASARVVVDHGVRREVTSQTVLLEAAALAAATNLEAKAIISGTRVVGAALIVAGERWADAHGIDTARVVDSLPVQVRAAGQSTDLRLAADRYLSCHHAPDPAAAEINEARLVACLVTHPTAIAPTLDWLKPGDLTNAPWRTVYAALEHLAATGQDVDLVTLSAQIMRTGKRFGPGPDLGALLRGVDAEIASVPGHLRKVVAGDQLRAIAAAGSTLLRATAEDPTTTVPELLGEAHVVLDRMRHLASVLPDDAAHPGGASRLRIVHTRDVPPPETQTWNGPVAG